MDRSDKALLDELCEVAGRMGAEGWGTWLESRRPLWADFVSRHAEGVLWDTEVDADSDKMNDYLYYLSERDGVCGGNFTLTVGTAVALTGVGDVSYRIGGQNYAAALDNETIALEDNGNIADGYWGAWRILIDKEGTVTVRDPKGSGSQAFSSEQDALLSLSQRARPAGTIDIAYFTIQTNSTFNIGTSPLSLQGGNTVRYARMPSWDNGLSAALGSGIAATSIGWKIGTVDAKANGLNLAQVAALNDQPFKDDDTIGSEVYGGHLVVTDLVGTCLVTLSQDGIAGTASASYLATAAAVGASLDAVHGSLPTIFTTVGRIIVRNNKDATFTYNTDDIVGADGTATITDVEYGEFDRTAADVTEGKIEAPTVPGTIAAEIPSALTASNARSLEDRR